MSMQLPKLSYLLLSYNRAKYIRSAVENAFAQDYAGELEIIISDDCSTDASYDIIKDCVANYTGDRRVIVTQTPQNGHLAAHTNHALTFATGEWIIRADDDDYSSVDRCSLIAEAICQFPDCTYVGVQIEYFDDSQEEAILQTASQPTRRSEARMRRFDLQDGFDSVKDMGSRSPQMNAWRKDCYDIFGALDPRGYYVDDYCVYLRANLLGSCVMIDHPILHFIRTASNNMCRGGDDGSRGYKAILRMEKFNDTYYNMTLPPLEKELLRYKEYLSELDVQRRGELQPWIDHIEELLQTRRLLADYWRKGCCYRYQIKKKLGYRGLFSWLRLLPMPVFAAGLATFRALFK